MKLLRKSKLNFLFFSVIFLFLSSCSVESNLPDKISKDIDDSQKIAAPPKQEQPSQPSNPGQNPSTPGQNPSTPGQNPSNPGQKPSNPSNPGIDRETQIDKDKTQEEKKNPGISQKPDLPPAVIEIPDEIEEKPGVIKITDDKKGSEQPKIPSFTPQKPSDEEKIIPEPFDPKKDGKETDVQLAQLKGYLSTLPSSFRITKSMQDLYPLTIIGKGKSDEYKNFSYVNFIDPIQNLNDKYSIKLDFSNAVVASTGASNQEKPINNVLLFLYLKDNETIKSSKTVSLFYKQEEASKINLIGKKLPDNFKNIFPSFLAFSLLNSNNDVISNPFFNQIGHVLNDRNFGVGLKDTFAEFSPEISDDEKEKYGFDVVSAQPDDENGKLRLNLQIWKIDKDTEIKTFLPNNKSLEFSGLAKNSDNIYQIELSKNTLEIDVLKNDVKKTLLEKDLNSVFSKGTFLKHLLDHLYIRVNAEINNKWIKLSEVQHDGWLFFPQIQSANLIVKQLIDNLTLERNGKKITWILNLKTVLLINNQILTPNGEFFHGKEKIHKISGVLEIN
ncbi:LppA family lipoprotein [Mesomycoplasma ovipneumoniae]|uniref:LppA family lipoprotein n=1 Tax=Mesomycoplasma ovipneumoniae TaxID=29562 RepID=A0AAW6Q8T5_9BACT|nr:LppA family lipoprotein [Mesomycoplasma ovipneumoniae]MDF9627654.1 LppA family lipoprotein [Mesomycoplasma ovipneumoniae]MDO4157618.1 LppA family lipoprotein [Mesomycoplasma ovipneumoniae]MDO4158431.1 LppA family lipoprotein [Mesomycoplasma ovipneumoniae]MDO6822017.1 LppA family lipoprotein [Mesomycoplasma ovipneumoniae]MDO6855406.1 LppA family lipoprotein [Mesomycoplasma ovipneumoniae]